MKKFERFIALDMLENSLVNDFENTINEAMTLDASAVGDDCLADVMELVSETLAKHLEAGVKECVEIIHVAKEQVRADSTAKKRVEPTVGDTEDLIKLLLSILED